MGSLVTQRLSHKFAPKVALFQLDESTSDTLTKVFAQCGIQTVPVAQDFPHRLAKEQFQGCVLRLDDNAMTVLDSVRSSRSNHRMIVYGIVSKDLDVRRFSKYGINAILDSGMDRSAALQVARSTCALLLHELRRYVRIPLVVEVTVDSGSRKFSGTSREISGGGMSIAFAEPARIEGKTRLGFGLPEKPPIKIEASPCWHNGSQIGFQFQDSDPGRQTVKAWINSFLGLE